MEKNESKIMEFIGMALGILSIILVLIQWCDVAIICAIIGLVLSIIERKKNKTNITTAGLITSIVGLVFAIVILIYSLIAFKSLINGGLGLINNNIKNSSETQQIITNTIKDASDYVTDSINSATSQKNENMNVTTNQSEIQEKVNNTINNAVDFMNETIENNTSTNQIENPFN